MQVGNTRQPQSDINVTPLIDVVLVLLIIFMVITPIILQETLLILPKMEMTDEPLDPNEPGALVVKLNADNTIALRVGEIEQPLNQAELADKISAQLNARRDKSVFVDASTLVAYGQVVTIFDLVKGAGGNLAIVETDEAPEGGDAGAPAPAAPAIP